MHRSPARFLACCCLLVMGMAFFLPENAMAFGLCGNKQCYVGTSENPDPKCSFSLFFFKNLCRDGPGFCEVISCTALTEGDEPDSVAKLCPEEEFTGLADAPRFELRSIEPRT